MAKNFSKEKFLNPILDISTSVFKHLMMGDGSVEAAGYNLGEGVLGHFEKCISIGLCR